MSRYSGFSHFIKVIIEVIVVWLLACLAFGWYDNNISPNTPNQQNNPNVHYTIPQDIATGRQQITNTVSGIIDNGL